VAQVPCVRMRARLTDSRSPDTLIDQWQTALGGAGTVCVLTPNAPNIYSAPHRQLGQTCAGTCNGTPRNTSCEIIGTDPAVGACWLEDGVACSNGVCVPPQKVGAVCASGKSCETTAHCASGLCVADSSSGPCTQNDQCLAATSACNYTLMTCVPLAANGEPCDQGDQCLGGQCYLDRCRTWSIAESGTCLGVLDD